MHLELRVDKELLPGPQSSLAGSGSDFSRSTKARCKGKAEGACCGRKRRTGSSKKPLCPGLSGCIFQVTFFSTVLGSPSPQPRNPENAKFRKLFQKNKSPILTLLD